MFDFIYNCRLLSVDLMKSIFVHFDNKSISAEWIRIWNDTSKLRALHINVPKMDLFEVANLHKPDKHPIHDLYKKYWRWKWSVPFSSFYRIFTRKFYSFLGHDSYYYSPSVIYFVFFFFYFVQNERWCGWPNGTKKEWVQNTAKFHRHRNFRISLICGADTATDVVCTNQSRWCPTAVFSSSLSFPLQKPEQSV